MVEWLQGSTSHGTHPWTLHGAAKRLYENGTGDWVFKTLEWDRWTKFQERAIWLHGIPGAGKTILASHVIEKIRGICDNSKKQMCIYYYCYHGHNRDESEPFLRWLISQLVQQQDEVPEPVWKAYTRRAPPTHELLLDILKNTLSSLDRVYIGIDALDESQTRNNILALLGTLVTEERFSKIQLFATSREYEDIKSKMLSISRPLSMSNSFVEADIRHFVAAKIRHDTRFQGWPTDLQNEVENTLSTGAKGMFRWAVCQLDIIRRLHHQSKIKEAIKSLPKTLDETYERIFSYVPDQDRDLLKHALHFVCFHDVLWMGEAPLPANVLLDSYTCLGAAGEKQNTDDFICDLELLKDVSGCIISFSREDDEETAAIAHYTVREFLESNREPTQRTAWTKINKENCYSAMLVNIFHLVLAPEAPSLCVEDYDNRDPVEGLSGTSNLEEYCVLSSARSLVACEELVDLSLAFRLLDSYATHYKLFCKILIFHTNDGAYGDAILGSYRSIVPWNLEWRGISNKSSSAATLVNLLVLECFGLATALALKVDMKQLVQQSLHGKVHWDILTEWFGDSCDNKGEFQGNIVEVLAQLRQFHRTHFEFIQETAPNLVSYQDLLPIIMSSSYPSSKVSDVLPIDHILQRLLDLGADPDPQGFRVTPLQIAIYQRDLGVVRKLLEVGADPNNAGDPEGTTWNNNSVLSPYNRFHGHAPIEILSFEPCFPFEDDMSREHIENANGVVTDEIRRILLSYGAKPS